jgi:hypothetical protein
VCGITQSSPEVIADEEERGLSACVGRDVPAEVPRFSTCTTVTSARVLQSRTVFFSYISPLNTVHAMKHTHAAVLAVEMHEKEFACCAHLNSYSLQSTICQRAAVWTV